MSPVNAANSFLVTLATVDFVTQTVQGSGLDHGATGHSSLGALAKEVCEDPSVQQAFYGVIAEIRKAMLRRTV